MSLSTTMTPTGEHDPAATGIEHPHEHAHERVLSELRRLVDHLWQTEPSAAPSTRSRLLEQLARLEHEIERLALRVHDGDHVDAVRIRACSDQADELRWWWRRSEIDLASA